MEAQFANYISLKDAAFMCDHSPDYLNLLVRKGKLKALKIGRNWVTKKEWLEKYLASQSGGKFNNYISLKDAASFCDHSPEYLNLLVRKGKLKALKLGRNWVTKKEWVEIYLNDVRQGRLRRIESKDAAAEIISEIESRKIENNSEKFLPESIEIFESEPLMPAPKPVGTIANISPIENKNNTRIFNLPNPKIIKFSFAACALAAIVYGGSQMVAGLQSNLIAGGKPILEQWMGNGSANLWQMFAGAGQNVGVKFAGIIDYLMNGKTQVISIVANAIPVEKIVFDESMKALEGNIVSDTQGRFDKFRKEFGMIGDKENPAQRVIVVPSSGDAAKDKQTQIKIKESFSDEVTVRPADETSGVIVPQFKDKQDQEYLYMTVPVNEDHQGM